VTSAISTSRQARNAPDLKSLSITYSNYQTHAKDTSYEVLDILRRQPLILPWLDDLGLCMDIFPPLGEESGRVNQAFRDFVHARKGVINKLSVSGVLGFDLMNFLSDNIPCVIVSKL